MKKEPGAIREGRWTIRVPHLADTLNRIWDEDGYAPSDLAEELLELACALKEANHEFHISLVRLPLQSALHAVAEAQAAYGAPPTADEIGDPNLSPARKAQIAAQLARAEKLTEPKKIQATTQSLHAKRRSA